MHELKIMLATVLREFRLRCLDIKTRVRARRGMVTGPRGGVALVCDGAGVA